jgi:hypothetical protein
MHRFLRVATTFVLTSLALAAPVRAQAPTPEALKAAGLTSAQLLTGAKAGLGVLVDLATKELAQPGALNLSAPPSMAKLESTLKRLNQTGALDGFKASLSQAAASVAPQATATLKAAVGPLTAADVGSLLGGPPDAGSKLLRKVTEANLRTKLIPLVKDAVAAQGSAAKAKDLLAKAGPMAAMMGVPGAADLETHVLNQVLDTTFTYLAKHETALRANPAAFKDALAAKVFAPAKK